MDTFELRNVLPCSSRFHRPWRTVIEQMKTAPETNKHSLASLSPHLRTQAEKSSLLGEMLCFHDGFRVGGANHLTQYLLYRQNPIVYRVCLTVCRDFPHAFRFETTAVLHRFSCQRRDFPQVSGVNNSTFSTSVGAEEKHLFHIHVQAGPA